MKLHGKQVIQANCYRKGNFILTGGKNIGRIFGLRKKTDTSRAAGEGVLPSEASSNNGEMGIEARIESLNDLFNKKLITQEEYSKKKAELLDEI